MMDNAHAILQVVMELIPMELLKVIAHVVQVQHALVEIVTMMFAKKVVLRNIVLVIVPEIVALD